MIKFEKLPQISFSKAGTFNLQLPKIGHEEVLVLSNNPYPEARFCLKALSNPTLTTFVHFMKLRKANSFHLDIIQVRIIGVEPLDANAMALSLNHGERVMLDQVGGFADGVAVKVVGEETFRLCRELVDGVVLVSRDAICASIKVTPYSLCFLIFAW